MLEGSLDGATALRHFKIQQVLVDDKDFTRIKKGARRRRRILIIVQEHATPEAERFSVQKLVFLWKNIIELRATADQETGDVEDTSVYAQPKIGCEV